MLLQLNSMNTPIIVCNMDRDYAPAGSLAGATTPAACKTIYAGLLAAKATEQFLPNVYFDGDTVPTACNGFTFLQLVNLRYFQF